MVKNIIDVDHVTIRFNLANEKTNNLKEYVIKMAKRQLMFQEFLALKDVNLHIKKGEAWGLIGTNGSGKSTLLKTIAGILQPYRGNVTVRGNIAPLIELGAGFDMEMTARENIFLNGTVLGHTKEFMQEHFEEIVDFADLGKFLDSPIKNFSSGMKTRLGFAVATMVNPQILIVDEVLSVGDYQFRKKCNQRMEEMLSGGTTLLFVSHNTDQVRSLCSHAIWLDHGETIMMGNAQDVCDAYEQQQEEISKESKKASEQRKASKRGKKYDYLVVGAGLFGSVFARQAYMAGKRCLVIDKAAHVGGAVYTEKRKEIDVYTCGPHIFRTEDKDTWGFLRKFSEFNNYMFSPMASYKGKMYSLPLDMNTFRQIWGVNTPAQAFEKMNAQREEASLNIRCGNTLEDRALREFGRDIYETLIRGYMEKVWGKKCDELPAELLTDFPMYDTYSNFFYPERYQGMPENGFTPIIEEILDGVEVRLNTSYEDFIRTTDLEFDRIIYTGSIDEYFNCCFGSLEYRWIRMVTEEKEINNEQGCTVIRNMDKSTPYLETIEHKHFAFGKQDGTVLSRLYVTNEQDGEERWYPVRTEENLKRLEQYRELAAKEEKVVFAGRLGEFRFCSMAETIENARELLQKLTNGRRIETPAGHSDM